MEWAGYGETWVVDHIRPISSFDLSEPEQRSLCFSWYNLQPLTRQQNIDKGDEYDEDDEVAWVEHLNFLGYEGPLFLIHTPYNEAPSLL